MQESFRITLQLFQTLPRRHLHLTALKEPFTKTLLFHYDVAPHVIFFVNSNYAYRTPYTM